MDIRSSDEYYHLVYDPLLHGYTDSYFKTASGVPAISTNVLRLNSAACYTTGQFMFGEYEFKLNVPTLTDAKLTMGAAGTTAITNWDQITNGEFAVTIDGAPYDVTGVNFSGGVYTPAHLTGGNAATATIDSWAAVTDGGLTVTLDGTLRHVNGINFKTAFPYTSAYLTGGNGATGTIDTWAAVTDGRFAITIDGTLRTITGLNFKTAFPYVSAYLTGGAAATTNVDTWAAVTDGSFAVTLDGTPRAISNIDFSAVAAYTPAFLTGGSSATAVPATWEAVTDGEFNISVNGVSHDIAAIDFSNVVAYTPAHLTGGGAATSNPAVWAAVADGEFKITINGVARTVTGVDFTGLTTMSQIAAKIQADLRVVTSLTETVTWVTDHFVITSSNTTSASAITVAATVDAPAGTDISGAGATDFMDADTGHGTVVDKVSNLTMNDVATKLQTVIRVATTGLETVVWSTNHFVVSSVNTTSTSAITVTAVVAAPAGTDVSGAGGTAFMDSDVGHGTVTNKVSLMTMSQVATKIQADLRVVTGGLETVVWSTDHFVVSSVNLTVDSAITVLSATGGGTDISGAGGTTFMDAEIAIGTVTAHTTIKVMADVATIIQTAIRALTLSTETVVWSTNHFVISSVNTTVDSAVTVASAAGGGTDLSGAGGTNFLDSDTGNGTPVVHTTTKTLTDVAALIQVALRALTTGLETVVWSTNHFVISSVNTTSISAISVLSAATAGTDLSGAGATNFMDGDVGNSTITARSMASQMTFVALTLQNAVQATTGQGDTLTWVTDHFILTSNTTLGVSSVSVLSAVAGGTGTDISGAGYMNGLVGTGTVSTASTKSFGLKVPAMGSTNYILFQIIGDKVLCRACDRDGNLDSSTVTWLATWYGAETKFNIKWQPDNIRFAVNGIEVAKLTTYMLKDVSLAVYLDNENADNMDLGYIYFKGVGKANNQFNLESINVDLNASDIEIGAVELKNGTDDTRAAILTNNALKTDLSSVAGTTTSVNTGNSDNGTARVVLASNQPTVASKLTADATTVGMSTGFDSDGDNTAQVIKASAGNLYMLTAVNSNVADAYIQLFDVAAGSVTVGVTAPKYVFPVIGQAAYDGQFTIPMSFATAITYACTTTPTGAGDPAVGLTVCFGFK